MFSQREPEMEAIDFDWESREEELVMWSQTPHFMEMGVDCTCTPWAHWQKIATDPLQFWCHIHHEDDCKHMKLINMGLN